MTSPREPLNHQTGQSNSSLAARHTVVITGGNSGLGYACARTLLTASPPWHVVLACRDMGRANAAVDTLRPAALPGAQVEAMELDLASLA